MAITPIPIGTDPWGALLNAQIQDLDGSRIDAEHSLDYLPEDHGITHWVFPPAVNQSTSILVSGTVYQAGISVREGFTANNVGLGVATAGSGLTAGQNRIGIYNAAGTLLGQTADQSADWVTSGAKYPAFTAPVVLTPGKYWIAVMSNGTTPITVARGSATLGNFNLLTGATFRWTTGGTGWTGLTALPSPGVMANRAAGSISFWTALG